MFGIIIVGHGDFPQGLVNGAEMILGEQEGLVAVPLLATDSPKSYLDKLLNITNSYDNIVILADLKGGTPQNLASFVVKERDCSIVTGVNLPMLLEIICCRMNGFEIDKSIETAFKLGRDGVLKLDKKSLFN